jgi:Ribonuclease HI
MMMCSDWGGEQQTTNQRMELMGALKGLQNLPNRNELKGIQYDEVEVLTDSAYLYRCMTEMWYIDWQFKDWIGSEGNPVKNRDLWERLISLVREYKAKGIKIVWTKIRGHKGVLYNEVADKLAVKGKKFYS